MFSKIFSQEAFPNIFPRYKVGLLTSYFLQRMNSLQRPKHVSHQSIPKTWQKYSWTVSSTVSSNLNLKIPQIWTLLKEYFCHHSTSDGSNLNFSVTSHMIYHMWFFGPRKKKWKKRKFFIFLSEICQSAYL